MSSTEPSDDDRIRAQALAEAAEAAGFLGPANKFSNLIDSRQVPVVNGVPYGVEDAVDRFRASHPAIFGTPRPRAGTPPPKVMDTGAPRLDATARPRPGTPMSAAARRVQGDTLRRVFPSDGRRGRRM